MAEVPGGVLGGGAGVGLYVCQTHMISWLLVSANVSCWRCLPASNLGEDRISSFQFQVPSSLWPNVAGALVSSCCLAALSPLLRVMEPGQRSNFGLADRPSRRRDLEKLLHHFLQRHCQEPISLSGSCKRRDTIRRRAGVLLFTLGMGFI